MIKRNEKPWKSTAFSGFFVDLGVWFQGVMV